MQVPVYGSNAYKYEEVYQAPKPKTVRKVRRVKRKAHAASGSAMLPVLAVLLAFGLLFSNSQIMEKNAEVEKLEKRLDTLQAQTVAGQFEIERSMDLNKIENEAITRLGMQRPTKAQTVYVNMGNCDYAETAVGRPARANVFSAFVGNVLEYFG